MGKVKTRLAATMGDEAALAIYYVLATYTRQVTDELLMKRSLWYSDYVDREDQWDNNMYTKILQQGKNLGERMHYAFQAAFNGGADEVCIIGTDCLELEQAHVLSAFEALKDCDVAIGPSRDGGYYLLGMKRMIPELFENKTWSTDQVFNNTVKDFERLDISYKKLHVLSDVDVDADLPKSILKKFRK